MPDPIADATKKAQLARCPHCDGWFFPEEGVSLDDCPKCGRTVEVPPAPAPLPGSEELAEALAEISAAGLGAVAEGLRLHISDLTRRQAKIEALESELRNIAYAKRSNFTDCYEFMLWAQSRAQHTLESTEVKP